MRSIILFLIKGYRYALSPLLAGHCRFYPSCSCYAEQAFKKYSFFSALYLTVKRLGRCHPWHHGGIDPLPENIKDSHG